MANNIYTTNFFKNLINRTHEEETKSRIIKIDNNIRSKNTKEATPSLFEFIFSSQEV
ncbi:hypothetical protein BH09PAT1_BH09PAT1_4760 [soil metagenome]